MKKYLSFFIAIMVLSSSNAMAVSTVNTPDTIASINASIQNQQEISHDDLEKAYEDGICEKEIDIHYGLNGKPSYKTESYKVTQEDGNNVSVSTVSILTFAKSDISANSIISKENTNISNDINILSPLNIIQCNSSTTGCWDDTGSVTCTATLNYSRIVDYDNSGYYKYKLVSCSGYYTIFQSGCSVSNAELFWANSDLYVGYNNVGSVSISKISSFSKTFSYTNWVSDLPAALGICGIGTNCTVKRGTATIAEFTYNNTAVYNVSFPGIE